MIRDNPSVRMQKIHPTLILMSIKPETGIEIESPSFIMSYKNTLNRFFLDKFAGKN